MLTAPDWFLSVGRKDDVITLSTGKAHDNILAFKDFSILKRLKGEKIVPLLQEGQIAAHPLVQGCIMFGRERAQAGLLVEPRSDLDMDEAEFRSAIKYVISIELKFY
jgi:hypothetical protein